MAQKLVLVDDIDGTEATETITAAVNGDPVAAYDILAYFNSYINHLCAHSIIYDTGRREWASTAT